MESSYPCICGHLKSDHFDEIKQWPMAGCAKRRGFGIRGTGWVDECKRFVPDNLRYLEEKANEK